jgi:putative hydrolase of the HAD superfamily
MNIIIPIGGKGLRFLNNGYNYSKPLIPVFGKEILFYLLDNLNILLEDKVFIIYYEDKIYDIVHKKYPYITFIKIKEPTRGASETLYIGLKEILEKTKNKKTMILDCDTFYTEDVISMYRNIETNAVFYVENKDENPIYSYISLNNENFLQSIEEKNKISDCANTGIYCFNNIQQLFEYSEFVVKNNIMFKNEFYTSCIIKQMLDNKFTFKGIQLCDKYVFNLGTPEQLNDYIKKTNIFLFDLDGTLVLTENIYFHVWKELLNEYDIVLTKELFEKCISGNNDKTSIKNIFKTDINISKISEKKDKLFIQYINDVKIIDGVFTVLNTIKKNGHKLAVVTNCNRKVSEKILHHLNIHHYFEFIIVGNECKNPKPYSDPYNEAIIKFNNDNMYYNEKTIIFEDTKTGLLSANGVSPKCIVGIETNYSKEDLLQNFANITIKNYINFDIDYVINYVENNQYEEQLKKNIINSIDLNIEEIIIDDVKMKGGFISDVLSLKIKINNNNILNCILKLENTKENLLSEISHKLDLYNREYYFYEEISKYISIKMPKYYGLVKDEKNNNIGLLLENINNNDYKLNLDLNKEDIKVSLTVIDSISKIHSLFWNNTILFEKLKKNNDKQFHPYWNEFIQSKWPLFKLKWENILTNEQLDIGEYIFENFSTVQQKLSENNLTLCHGDVKSPNIFYKIKPDNNYEPYFIDWQYIINGKGVQDLVFFMIESFEIEKMDIYKKLFKEYYYVKLIENGIHYSRNEYEEDFKNASFYFPFFVAMWFGTINEDELIDKEFPCKFIKKLFHFYTI